MTSLFSFKTYHYCCILFLVNTVKIAFNRKYSHCSAMRLGHIKGYAKRSNEIVYISPTKAAITTDVVVFFPGDIQNYGEQMLEHSQDSLRYNLEGVAEDLSVKLPTKHIIVVKPVRTEKGVYNHYDNFVNLGKFGGPDYLKGRNALPHLLRLVHNTLDTVTSQPRVTTSVTSHVPSSVTSHVQSSVTSQTRVTSPETQHQDINNEQLAVTCRTEQQDSDEDVSAADSSSTCDTQQTPELSSVSLVAFSKGCVVLNQIVTEIYLMSELAEEERTMCENFLGKVQEMAWLDGGHQGREGTWITNPNFVRKLVQTMPQMNIVVHVTPYQMSDSSRPWIGNECRRFVSLCREAAGDRLSHTLHGEDHYIHNLATHFLALQAYAA